MAFQPLGDRVLIKPIEEKEQVKGGIIIPDTAKEKPQEGTIVSLGTGRRNEKGDKIPFEIKKGDVVLYEKWGGTEIKIKGESFLVMNEDKVIGILK